MEATEALQALLRWIHIVAGIIWIGLLYFFNFVNAGFAATMDGPTKQKVVPELMPRALYWFRWGAAWTWVTGVLLLVLVFWHGGNMFGAGGGSGTLAVLMVLATFLAAAAYDVVAKSGWSKDIRLLGGVGWALAVLVILGYRAAGFGSGARSGAGRARGRPLAAQHLSLGAAHLDDDQLAHRRPLRGERLLPDPRHPARVGGGVPDLQQGGDGKGVLSRRPRPASAGAPPALPRPRPRARPLAGASPGRAAGARGPAEVAPAAPPPTRTTHRPLYVRRTPNVPRALATRVPSPVVTSPSTTATALRRLTTRVRQKRSCSREKAT